MAKPKKQEPKLILERECIVPLRKEWLKVPRWKRGNKAVKTLKEFIARHMKVYDRDLKKIKIDMDLNNELRFRGMRKPPAKIKVKAKKFDNGIVKVELVELPTHVKFARLKEEKKKVEFEKKKESEKKAEVKEKIKEKEEPAEAKEKEETSKEANLELAKQQAKAEKHTSKEKAAEKQWVKSTMQRITLLWDDEEVRPEYIEFLFQESLGSVSPALTENVISLDNLPLPEKGLNLNAFILNIVKKALDKHQGNKTDAALYLGISRHVLYTYLKRLDELLSRKS